MQCSTLLVSIAHSKTYKQVWAFPRRALARPFTYITPLSSQLEKPRCREDPGILYTGTIPFVVWVYPRCPTPSRSSSEKDSRKKESFYPEYTMESHALTHPTQKVVWVVTKSHLTTILSWNPRPSLSPASPTLTLWALTPQVGWLSDLGIHFYLDLKLVPRQPVSSSPSYFPQQGASWLY